MMKLAEDPGYSKWQQPPPGVLRSIEEIAPRWRVETSARKRSALEQRLVGLFLQAWTISEHADVALVKCFAARQNDWLEAQPWASEHGLAEWAKRKRLKPPEQWRKRDVVPNLKRFFRDEYQRLKLADGVPVTLWYGIEEVSRGASDARKPTSDR